MSSIVPTNHKVPRYEPHPKDRNRQKNGGFAPGNNANPRGAYTQKGLQKYSVRVEYWMNKMSMGELAELASDSRKFARLNPRDAMIIIHILSSIRGLNVGAERERLLNRLEGMPKQVIEQKITTSSPALTQDYDDTQSAEMSYAEQMANACAEQHIEENIEQHPDGIDAQGEENASGSTEYYEPGEESPGDGMAS